MLAKLKDAGCKASFWDLRRNGGGFLTEAINLTGLFIPPGPVCQVRDALGYLKQMTTTIPTLVLERPAHAARFKEAPRRPRYFPARCRITTAPSSWATTAPTAKERASEVWQCNVIDPS